MKPDQTQRLGDPTVATLLTWLVPGAGHVYLGRTRLALIGFAVLQALYLAGVLLSNGMFLEYLPTEMRGRFSAALTPEAGNLGALLLHVRQYGFGGTEPRPWPAWMDLGTTLTAASGILNLLLASHANLLARLPRGLERQPRAAADPALAAALTWVLPGLGHMLQGRRARGLVALLLLVGLFGLATTLAQGSNLDRERHFYYWAGQFLLGPVALITEFVHGHPRLEALPAYKDAGVMLGSIAGMLNVLLMLDVYGYAETRALRPDEVGPSSDSGRVDPAAAAGAPIPSNQPAPLNQPGPTGA